MERLQEGSKGPAVEVLQAKLKELGFPPGKIDGDFGPGTEAAVKAFQHDHNLLDDGVVGTQTASALGFEEADLPPPEAMPNMTVSIAAKMVPGAHLDTLQHNLPLLLLAFADTGLTAKSMVLYAIATIRVETSRFEPISEFISRFNTSPGGNPFDLYDFKSGLGNGALGDGEKYKGRGFIQLTGKANYRQIGNQIGIDLVDNPEQANDPAVAAKVLAAYLKSRHVRIKQALAEEDFRDARRAVNPAALGLAEFTQSYKIGAALLG